MIPLVFCGDKRRDWPRWQFWKRGHHEHDFKTKLSSYNDIEFETLAHCPGHKGDWLSIEDLT